MDRAYVVNLTTVEGHQEFKEPIQIMLELLFEKSNGDTKITKTTCNKNKI